MTPTTWGETLRDPALIVSMWVTGQFFVLVVLFGGKWISLEPSLESTVMQTYVVAFTAAWGYWLGSSSGSKAKDALLNTKPEVKS